MAGGLGVEVEAAEDVEAGVGNVKTSKRRNVKSTVGKRVAGKVKAETGVFGKGSGESVMGGGSLRRAGRATVEAVQDDEDRGSAEVGNATDLPGAVDAVGTANAPGVGDATRVVCFSLTGLLGDLRGHLELDLETLGYHLRQSDATAAEGYWHAAINEARSFLEALVVGILVAVERQAESADVDGSKPAAGNGSKNRSGNGNGSTNGTPFRCYRRRLVEAGFLDAHENELLQYVYGVSSAKGSHHGVTDEAWSRLARRMVWTAGQYVIHRYAAWKRAGRRRRAAGVSPRGGPAQSASGWRWWSVLAGYLRRFRA